MNTLAAEGLRVDLELRKKLNELLDLRAEIKASKAKESNPIKEKEHEDNIRAIDEIIGKIRYISLDELGILSPKKEEEEDLE